MPFDAPDQPPVPTFDEFNQAILDINKRVDGLPAGYDDAQIKQELADLENRLKKLEDAPPVQSGAILPGIIPFTSFAALADWMDNYPSSGPREEVKFPTKILQVNPQIPLYSGHRLIGTYGPAREYDTGCVLTLAPGLPSFFKQVTNVQNYPGSTGVRDFNVQGMEFKGNGSTPVLPAHERSEGVTNNAVYYTQFKDCGFSGSLLLKGWCDGLHIDGDSHVNSIVDTFITAGGSILEVGAGGGRTYMDSAKAAWTDPRNSDGSAAPGKPFIETFCTQWTVNRVEISARGRSYALLISGGGNGRVNDFMFDAPDGAKTLGPQVRITGGDSVEFSGGSFHNGGGISVEGGSGEVIVANNIFRTSSAVLTVGSAFTGKVLMDYNAYPSTPKVVKVANLSQIICDDPRLQILDLNGAELRKPAA